MNTLVIISQVKFSPTPCMWLELAGTLIKALQVHEVQGVHPSGRELLECYRGTCSHMRVHSTKGEGVGGDTYLA